jgi:hypothetical protein
MDAEVAARSSFRTLRHTHPTVAELLEDFVMRYCLPDHRLPFDGSVLCMGSVSQGWILAPVDIVTGNTK